MSLYYSKLLDARMEHEIREALDGTSTEITVFGRDEPRHSRSRGVPSVGPREHRWLEALHAELTAHRAELSHAQSTLDRVSKLMRGAVDGLKGPPPELVLWSFHDAPELAAAARAVCLAAVAYVERAHHVDGCASRYGAACDCGKHAPLDALVNAGYEVTVTNVRDASALPESARLACSKCGTPVVSAKPPEGTVPLVLCAKCRA